MNAAALVSLDSADVSQPVKLRFAVPLEDSAEFSGVPAARRTEVQVAFKLLERIHALRGPERSLQAACETVAASSKHLMRGCSASSLRRKYEAYVGSGGDWHELVAGYKGPKTTPEAFDEYVKKLAEDNHRSMAEAFQLLLHEWRSGQPIPGYGTWIEYHMREYPTRPMPRTCPLSLIPNGWSQRTLYRKAPNKGARMLFQRGIAAAKRFFPSVIRDTSALRPMEYIAIDDFELDCLCVFPGDGDNKPQIGRVAGLLAIDVATRRKLYWGVGQRLERIEEQPDGTTKTVRTGISRLSVQGLLHGLFEKFGLPEYTVTIICENASAAIAPELELAFSTLFEGRIRIERTGLIEHHTLTNGFTERGGKPWEKGWIEAAFNGLWNIMGSMPGYKGSNQRLNGPADLDAKINYTKLLIGHGERSLNLPPEKIALLRLPFPSVQAVEQTFAWACASSDSRPNHRYQGFDRVTEFELMDGADPVPFLALATLSPEQQLAAKPLERIESPIERWSRLGGDTLLRPIPNAALAILLLTPKEVTYRNHAISFAHDKKGYSYTDRTGKVLAGVVDGTKFLGFFNQRNPLQLHVTTLKGALVGTLERLGGARGAIDIRDRKALRAEADHVQAIVAEQLTELRVRHADQDAQQALDNAHNESIKAEHLAATKGLSTAIKIGLAAGDDARREAEERLADKAQQRDCKAVAAEAQARAAALTDDDKQDFLTQEDPAAPAETSATGSANVAAQDETLSDYI